MRFIGSKNLLLDNIKNVINKNIPIKSKIFCDIFSGTACVANFFKDDYKIISNDLLYLSYVLQRSKIKNNTIPKFERLNIKNPIMYFNESKIDLKDLKDLKDKPFIYEEYSPNKKSERRYFSNTNAIKIDFIRQTIKKWKDKNLINQNEYYYLLAAVIEAIPFISNIAGTYGAYLKHWDKRVHKDIELINPTIKNNNKKNECYNLNANILIKKIRGDILYIDPPYNTRQYLPNYHILETVSRYDNPKIYGKTGLRPYEELKSDYCMKSRVCKTFSNLIKDARFKYIILSYNSEGLMKEKEIQKILIENGKPKSYKIYKYPYRRYKHTKDKISHSLEEYLFFIEK